MYPGPLKDALDKATRKLEQANVDSPRLAAEVLLAHVLNVSRAHLLAHLDQPLAHPSTFHSLVDRCAGGEPLAYVTGRKAFYDLELSCDPRALIPRPETELLVETLLTFHLPPVFNAVDVGAGTGCIAITLAAQRPAARVYATDISPEALELAQRNARQNGVSSRVTFLLGDLLDPLPEPVHAIAANLPYVTTSEWRALPDHIRLHEPRLALDGGEDGLDLIRRLLVAAPTHLLPGGVIVLEIGAAQGQAAAQLARAAFPLARVSVRPDYAGLDRLVMIET